MARIESLPLEKREENELRKRLDDVNVLDRLLKRFQIASAIAAAQEEGLFEAAEDVTARVDLGDEDSIRANE